MKSRRNIYIIILGLLVVGLSLWFILGGSSANYNWRENYSEKGKNPYGTAFIQGMLKSYFPNESFEVIKDSVHLKLPLDQEEHSTYVAIGQSMYYSEESTDHLLEYLRQGNDVFIACKFVPHKLMYYLYDAPCPDNFWKGFDKDSDSTVQLNFIHPMMSLDSSLVLKWRQGSKEKALLYDWPYFPADFICDTYSDDIVPLGKFGADKMNFVKMKYGAGNVYMHSTPLAFSNYALVEESGFEYASRVFSYLKEGSVYWDAFSRVSENVAASISRQDIPFNKNLSSESPLQYILSQPPLKWAWYMLVAAGILYLVFRSKRRQRILPILPENKNSSLEFVKTMGALYYGKRHNKKLADQKIKFFFVEIHEKYGLRMNVDAGEKQQQLLAQKAKESVESVKKIFTLCNNIIKSSFVSDKTLIDLHQLISQFLKGK